MNARTISQTVCGMLFLGVALMGGLPAANATNTVSRPCGFVRLVVPGASHALVAMPFQPFNTAINALFSDQLAGAATMTAADRIQKWSVTQQSYTNAYKADATGDGAKNGKWFVDFTNWSTSTMAFEPGDGFWIKNSQTNAQTVFVYGAVALDAVRSNAFPFGLALFGYPYAGGVALNSTDLGGDGALAGTAENLADNVQGWNGASYDTWFFNTNNTGAPALDWKWCRYSNEVPYAASNVLMIGEGFWYRRRAAADLAWTESRSYENPFPGGGEAPAITGMTFNSAKDEITLAIRTTGASGEVLDVYYKDVARTGVFASTGWSIAATNLATSGQTNVTWTDAGGAGRGKIDTIDIRCYLVGRRDIDGDADGLPDSREAFVYGSDPGIADSDGDGLSDGAEIAYGVDPCNPDTDGDGMGDGAEVFYGYDPAGYTSFTGLPFADAFETATAAPGDLDGQNNWTGDPGGKALVQTNVAHGGSQAIQLQSSYAGSEARHILAAQDEIEVWSDFYLRPVRRLNTNAPSLSPQSAVGLYVDANGRLVARNGTTGAWVTMTNHAVIGTSEWVRLTVKQDFSNQTWSLWLNTAVVATNLGFSAGAGEYTVFRVVGATKSDATYLDDVTVTNAMPADIDSDGDGMPDWWELHYGLDPYANNAGMDADGDGVSNLDEYRFGTDPNNNASFPADIAGTTSYGGVQTGQVYVVAVLTSNDWSTTKCGIAAAPGSYAITNLPTLNNYWVKAWRDSDGDGSNDYWEARGVYVMNPLNLTNDATNIAVTLTDPGDDLDSDGIADWWEIHYFGSIAGCSPSGDDDGDGTSNLAEYLQGRDPTRGAVGDPDGSKVDLRVYTKLE